MKKYISLLLALFLMFSLCACGESSGSYNRADQKAEATYATSDYAAEEAWYDYESPAGEPMPMPTTAPESAVSGLSPSSVNSAGGKTESPAERPGKIIYSSSVQVETTDFDGTLAKLNQLVEDYGGWVESSSVSGSNYSDISRGRVSRRSASYTLRIPSERFQEMMNGLSVLGNVPYSYIYSENVTAQYYDVQARLTAYSTQEQRLLEMMELAETVEDVILLEDRLTQVRYQIESLQSTLNNWDRQVSYSSVYLDISEVQEYSPEPQVQPSYGQQLVSALKEGLHSFGQFFEDLLLVLAAALPTLLLLALIVVVIVVIVKKSRKARRAAKAAKAAKAVEPLAPPAQEKEGSR